MDFKDYYEALGVARDAPVEQIRTAYRRQARRYHPDVNKDPEATATFREVNEANEVLSDPEKRKKYDRYGAAWEQVQEGAPPPPEYEDLFSKFGQASGDTGQHGGFSSFFDHLFGGQGSRGSARWSSVDPAAFNSRQEWTLPGTDAEATISLTLEEAAAGGQRQFTITDRITGKGRTLRVNIPAGLQPGARIRLAGQGSPGRGKGEAGDLFLVADLLPHGQFTLKGNDLYRRLPVAPWVAVLGGQVPMRTLTGKVTVKVPADSASGSLIRLKGQGYPAANGAGDLYAEVDIEVPSATTEDERSILQQWQDLSDFVPSAG